MVKSQVGAGASPGADVEEVGRFRAHPFLKEKRFWLGLFTPGELARLAKFKDPYPHAAGIFSAKEAVIKSLSAFDKSAHLGQIEIRHERSGRPVVVFRTAASAMRDIACRVSISHTRDLALAVAVCQTDKNNYGAGRDKKKNQKNI